MSKPTNSFPGVQGTEDQIDFRCSPLYQNHYADQGLTPRRLPAPRKRPFRITAWNDEIQAARERIAELERENRLLRLEKWRLQGEQEGERRKLDPPEKHVSPFRGIDLNACAKD